MVSHVNSISSIVSNLYDGGLSLVYPQSCAVCSRSVESRHDGVVCDACWKATRVLSESDTFCWKCGALSRAQIIEEKRQSIRCGKCDDEAYTAARACGAYEGALRALILQLKRERHVCRRLVALMYEAQRREPLNRADLIVPVPLHADRERERGFNQSVVLGRELSLVSGLPLDEHSAVRLIHTERHRAGMDAKARQRSVTGAFAVRHTDLIAGRSVLLVDDVLTTGATVSACARALRDSGADDVFVLTIARA